MLPKDAVWICGKYLLPVSPTKYKKRIYQRKSIRKVISQCVCLLYTHTYPPYQTGYAPALVEISN